MSRRESRMDKNRRFLQCHLRVMAARVFARDGASRATIIGKSFSSWFELVDEIFSAREYDHALGLSELLTVDDFLWKAGPGVECDFVRRRRSGVQEGNEEGKSSP